MKNTDQRSEAYNEMSEKFRPSHADYTYQAKFGIRAWPGGGRTSARETVGRVAAGAIAKKILREKFGVEVLAYVSQVQAIAAKVDPAKVKSEISKAFDGWTGGKTFAPPAPVVAKAVDKIVTIPDKTSVSVVIGQPMDVEARNPDWLPLDLGNAILGRSFTSRLMGNVRDREGLTYGIGSRLSGDTFRPGAWFVRATFAPDIAHHSSKARKKGPPRAGDGPLGK